MNNTITLTLYFKKIRNTKTNATFEKPFVTYRRKRFEAVLSKSVREQLLKDGAQYPISIDLEDGDYFMKRVGYTRNDGTHGTKYQVVILGYHNPQHTEFEKLTIDDIVDDLEDNTSAATPK